MDGGKFGRLDKAYDRLTSPIKRAYRVLDLGCGTGALTLRAAKKGARVKGIDLNPRMLQTAQKRIVEANLEKTTELCDMGVAELGSEEESSYDVVMSGLCFSELTEGELIFTLKEVKRILKPGGWLCAADEARPEGILKRILSRLVRTPLAILTYLLTQTKTRAVKSLPEKVLEAGLTLKSVKYSLMEDFIELISEKP